MAQKRSLESASTSEESSTKSARLDLKNSNQTISFPFVIANEYTPHIAQKIFDYLDREALVKCRIVSKSWKELIDYKTCLWKDVTPQGYIQAVDEKRLDICRLIIANADNKNPAYTSDTQHRSYRYYYQITINFSIVKAKRLIPPKHRET